MTLVCCSSLCSVIDCCVSVGNCTSASLFALFLSWPCHASRDLTWFMTFYSYPQAWTSSPTSLISSSSTAMTLPCVETFYFLSHPSSDPCSTICVKKSSISSAPFISRVSLYEIWLQFLVFHYYISSLLCHAYFSMQCHYTTFAAVVIVQLVSLYVYFYSN